MIRGEVTDIKQIDFEFDYDVNYGLGRFQGTAEVQLKSPTLIYHIKPMAKNFTVSGQTETRLQLEVQQLLLNAHSKSVKLSGDANGDIQKEINDRLNGYLDRKLSPDVLTRLSELFNEHFISYDEHTTLYDGKMEVDY